VAGPFEEKSGKGGVESKKGVHDMRFYGMA
jgi:hypothetical protein